jgi:CRP-like cAMP-binding protein
LSLGKRFCTSCSGCEARLEGRSLFSRFSEEGLKVLDDCASARLYPAGQALFNEGDTPEGLHCLHKGLVKLYKISSDGKPGFLRLAEPGYPLGYRAFFIDGVYSCSAVAMKDSEICYLPRTSISGLMESEPSLGKALLKTLADDLASAEKNWLETAQRPVVSRVCRLLLELESLEAWPPRGEMALMLSITPEVFARTLSALQKKGYLKRNRRKLVLTDRDALAALVEGRRE